MQSLSGSRATLSEHIIFGGKMVIRLSLKLAENYCFNDSNNCAN